MCKFKNGTLVRFVFHDEIYSEDFINSHIEEYDIDLGEMVGLLEGMGVRALLKFESVELIDKYWYQMNIDDFDYVNIPFTTRGMIVDSWQGQNADWYKILVGEKTVWTFGQNLVKLPKPSNGDENE